jgi:DNA transposition AAA+ family ATPase
VRKVFVKTQNVKKLIALMNNMQDRAEGVPGMALVYGEPGLGKTKAILWWVARNNAVFIRGTHLMTGRWLLEELAEELGESPYFRSSDLFRQCVKQLIQNPRIIVVDEVDYLATDRKIIETLRDIHDKADVPIILVGMGHIDKKLTRYKHLYDRILEKLRFEAFNIEDINTIVSKLCEVEMTDCAMKFIHNNANRFRQIVKIIDKAEKIAQANGLSVIDEITLKEFINDVEISNIKSN